MRISDWSSDVCSSDLTRSSWSGSNISIWRPGPPKRARRRSMVKLRDVCHEIRSKNAGPFWVTFDIFFDGPGNFARHHDDPALSADGFARLYGADAAMVKRIPVDDLRSEEHTSELQSLMRNSYAVFC